MYLEGCAKRQAASFQPDYAEAYVLPSCNHGGENVPQAVVVHATEGELAGALAHLRDPESGVSAHYVIDRERKGVSVGAGAGGGVSCGVRGGGVRQVLPGVPVRGQEAGDENDWDRTGEPGQSAAGLAGHGLRGLRDGVWLALVGGLPGSAAAGAEAPGGGHCPALGLPGGRRACAGTLPRAGQARPGSGAQPVLGAQRQSVQGGGMGTLGERKHLTLDLVFQARLGYFEVIARLEIEPELRGGAEGACQTKGGIGRDRCACPGRWH